jgi:hypothetical protein
MRNVIAALVVVAVVAFGFYVGGTDTTENGLQSMNGRNFDSPMPQLAPAL